MRGEYWNENHDAELKRLWNLELSASQIASVMRFSTRGGVCARARRLKLPDRIRKSAAGTSQRRRAKPLEKFGVPPTPIDDQTIPIPQRKKLVELTAETCHWPVGEPASPQFFFCGATTDIAPYCPAHALRALKASEATTLAATP